MSYKRLILEQSDDGELGRIPGSAPEEYEFPTRGQSFSAGVRTGMREWTGRSLIAAVIILAIIWWRC